MSNNTKLSLIQQILRLKNSVLQFSQLPFADILSTEALLTIIGHSTSSRDRLFAPLVTLKSFIFQVISTDVSCRQAVSHVLAEQLLQGQSANSINTGAYCKARKRLPLGSLKETVASLGNILHQQAHQTWL